MAERRLWTREELILALNLYLKLPFGKLHSGNKDIIHLAGIINRTPGSVAMRLNNYASVDPFHQQRGIGGLPGGKKQVEPIWNEFVGNRDAVMFESEKILANKEHVTIEKKYADILADIKDLKGEDKIRQVKTRVNQEVFREIVVANYEGKCAITGIDIQPLLLASHIIPWSDNKEERLNPENGICLSALYDRAYDKGYIGVNERLQILISKHLKKKAHTEYYAKHFAPLEGTAINKPGKYLPRKEFLQYHLGEIFEKHAII
ncbi:MAG TPA: HNH endonuclease [Chitinophagaceae bacterium]|nr:HNH endonuclease [Chitinophagaceae bacterium]